MKEKDDDRVQGVGMIGFLISKSKSRLFISLLTGPNERGFHLGWCSVTGWGVMRGHSPSGHPLCLGAKRL